MPVAGQVTVGAGCTLAALQRVVRAQGFDVGVDFAARDSCTVGGMVATNAGGERVLRYGTMRAQVVGIEAVLADGSVISRLAGLPKDNTGYDLVSLLAGSEGTLAVITRLRLRLVPLLGGRAVALVARRRHGRGGRAGRAAARAAVAGGGRAVLRRRVGAGPRSHRRCRRRSPVEHPAYLLVECAGRADPTDDLLAALDAAGDLVLDATVGERRARPRRVVGLPRVAHRVDQRRRRAGQARRRRAAGRARRGRARRCRASVADGRPARGRSCSATSTRATCTSTSSTRWTHDEAVTDAVLRLVASYGGSISAEHGVGRAKAAWLLLSRSAAEIAVMRAIKTAVDPAGLLNPGVLLPPT